MKSHNPVTTCLLCSLGLCRNGHMLLNGVINWLHHLKYHSRSHESTPPPRYEDVIPSCSFQKIKARLAKNSKDGSRTGGTTNAHSSPVQGKHLPSFTVGTATSAASVQTKAMAMPSFKPVIRIRNSVEGPSQVWTWCCSIQLKSIATTICHFVLQVEECIVL